MRTPKNRLQNAQMGMFFILATELMMFLALVSAYIVIRANVPDWPPIGQPRLPAGETALNTIALLLSGWTFYKAIKISKGVKDTFETDFTEIQNSVVKWIWIIGCHAIHTLAGLVLLLILGLKPSYIKLHTIKWYWYFVVGLWPLLYVSVYLV